MWRALLLVLLVVPACGEISKNTKVAERPEVRGAMLASVIPGKTTEGAFTARWGNPTQKIREGGQVSYVYRDMSNPPGTWFPAYGDSSEFVVVTFQYGQAINAYSGETQGCRATFPPRPPGPGFDNPSTVYPVNCGLVAMYANHGGAAGPNMVTRGALGVPPDRYTGDGRSK